MTIPANENMVPMGTNGEINAVKNRVFIMFPQRSPISTGCPSNIKFSSSLDIWFLFRVVQILCRLNSLTPQNRSKQLNMLEMQELVMKRKKKSVTSPVQFRGRILSAAQASVQSSLHRPITRLEKKVVITMLMKNMQDSLLATMVKNLLWVPQSYFLAQYLITIPSIELNTATTVATIRLRKVVVTTLSPSERVLIQSLSARIVRNAAHISNTVPISIQSPLFYSFCSPMFSQMISLASVRCSRLEPSISESLMGYSKNMITLP